MNKLKAYTALAGTSLAFVAGCSSGNALEKASKPAPIATSFSPSPEQSSPPVLSEADQYFANKALSLQQEFEKNIQVGNVKVKRILGACAVIAYRPVNEGEEVVVLVPNPVTLGGLDKKTGESISIVATYNHVGQNFIYGPVHLGKQTNSATQTRKLSGETRETDLFLLDSPQTIGEATLRWSRELSKPVDEHNEPIMDIASVGLLSGSLEDYAMDDITRLVCEAALSGDAPSQTATVSNA